MKQKKMLALTPSQLKQLYRHELPELTGIAARSGDAQTFKTYLSEYMAGHPQAESEAGKLIRLLIDYDGQKVHELSTDKQLPDWMRMCNNSGHTTKNVSCMPLYRK